MEKQMVVPEADMVSPAGEVESSPLQTDQQQRPSKNVLNHPFSSLGRQSSIYSLTLDEFQHAVCQSGKNFGSMNMDEFLASIWTAEENQNQASNTNMNTGNHNNQNRGSSYEVGGPRDAKGISTQPSLPRQGSLTLPAPLCRRTVDEVWSEMHTNGQEQQGNIDVSTRGGGGGNAGNPDSAHRQPMFKEMTLEDFLTKAGVVREQQGGLPPPMPAQQHQHGLHRGGNGNANSGFVSSTVPGVATGGGSVSYPLPMQAGVYGVRVENGGGGYMAVGDMVGPRSPVSNSEGMVGGSCVNDVGYRYGMDRAGMKGRKRILEGPVEKVVERRQRRMIKNRESAARSRARKQAYTVELEAELTQLKEENKQLKQALAELERKRKQQQYSEEMRMKTQTKAQKAEEILRMMRRNMSCPL